MTRCRPDMWVGGWLIGHPPSYEGFRYVKLLVDGAAHTIPPGQSKCSPSVFLALGFAVPCYVLFQNSLWSSKCSSPCCFPFPFSFRCPFLPAHFGVRKHTTQGQHFPGTRTGCPAEKTRVRVRPLKPSLCRGPPKMAVFLLVSLSITKTGYPQKQTDSLSFTFSFDVARSTQKSLWCLEQRWVTNK